MLSDHDYNFSDLPIAGASLAALQGFARQATTHPEVSGVLLYGSALWKPAPADLDFVIVLAKAEYSHFYGVHQAANLRCEVEYVTAPVLEDYLKYPHWRVSDWELDVGAKYIHGRILADKQGALGNFRERVLGPEGFKVRRYLFVHHIGQAISRLSKLSKSNAPLTEVEKFQLIADFAHALDAVAYNANLTFPHRNHTFEGWPLTPAQQTALISPGEIEFKNSVLCDIEKHGINRLELHHLFADCQNSNQILERLPIYHLVDYTGLEHILEQIRPDLSLPPDLMMPLFNG